MYIKYLQINFSDFSSSALSLSAETVDSDFSVSNDELDLIMASRKEAKYKWDENFVLVIIGSNNFESLSRDYRHAGPRGLPLTSAPNQSR